MDCAILDVVYLASCISLWCDASSRAWVSPLAWSLDKIHKHLQALLKAKVRQLRSELKNTKKATHSISEYFLRIKAIVDSLKAIGDSVSENEHIDAILEGLPEEYNSFVMLIYSRSNTPSIDDNEVLLMVQ